MLSSIRVHVQTRKDQEGGAVEPASLNVVMVEAEDQQFSLMPTNALLAMQPFLKTLAPSNEELRITTLEEISVQPHVGMVVSGGKCAVALVLLGATEKSEFTSSGTGYRLVTKNMVDVKFGKKGLKPVEC